MGFEEFKEKLLKELQAFLGDNMEVSFTKVDKAGGKGYEGLQAREKGKRTGIAPIVNLESLYEGYSRGGIQIGECIQTACMEMGRGMEGMETVRKFAEKAVDWNQARADIYPVLLAEETNREYLEGMVHTRMLDMAVAYIIRGKLEGGTEGAIRITKGLLRGYGVELGELHRQAMENLKRDGYQFHRMEDILEKGLGCGPEKVPDLPGPRMYVFTNRQQMYGAAGILDKKMLKEFAGGKDYYILPSSVHETIFVPAEGVGDSRDLSRMVAEINRQIVKEEERLSDHSYYYDAGADEIRMCA